MPQVHLLGQMERTMQRKLLMGAALLGVFALAGIFAQPLASQ